MAERHNRSGGPLLRHTIDSLITERATRYFQHIMDFGVDTPPDSATRTIGEVTPLASRSTCIDLFCGAGGLSEGFRQAGFHVLVGQDIDEVAGATFTATHSGAKFLGGPIQKLGPEAILRAARAKPGEIDALVGGPRARRSRISQHNHIVSPHNLVDSSVMCLS